MGAGREWRLRAAWRRRVGGDGAGGAGEQLDGNGARSVFVLRRANARVRARGARADDPVGLRRRRRRPRRRLGVGSRRTFGKGARVGAGRGDPRGRVGGGAAARRVGGPRAAAAPRCGLQAKQPEQRRAAARRRALPRRSSERPAQTTSSRR